MRHDSQSDSFGRRLFVKIVENPVVSFYLDSTHASCGASGAARWQALYCLVPVILSAITYWPITGYYFLLDDYDHLYTIANRGLLVFVLRTYMGHMLTVRNLVFGLCYELAGPHAGVFHAVALATHLLNVALLFFLVRRMTSRPGLASFSASLWGISPGHMGTLGWFSVHGHALATTFLLAAVLLLVRERDWHPAPRLTTALLSSLSVMLASQSFGTAISAAMIFPLVLWLLWPDAVRARSAIPLMVLPVLVATAYALFYLTPAWLPSRPVEGPRLFAILLSDPSAIFVSTAGLTAFGTTMLLLGPLYSAERFPDALAASVFVGASAAIVVVLRSGGRQRRDVLAMLILALASWAIVAVGRIGLVGQFGYQLIPRVVTTPRWHYQATAFLTLALAVALSVLGTRFARRCPTGSALRLVRPLAGLWLAILFALSVASIGPEQAHAAMREGVRQALEDLRATAMREPVGAVVCVPNTLKVRLAITWNTPELRVPDLAALFMIFYPTNQIAGRRVYFVTQDPVLLEARKAPGRLQDLLLSPEECRSRGSGAVERSDLTI